MMDWSFLLGWLRDQALKAGPGLLQSVPSAKPVEEARRVEQLVQTLSLRVRELESGAEAAREVELRLGRALAEFAALREEVERGRELVKRLQVENGERDARTGASLARLEVLLGRTRRQALYLALGTGLALAAIAWIALRACA